MAVEVQVAQGEQAATAAFRAPSARRGAHPPSRVSAPPSSVLLTQPAHISVPQRVPCTQSGAGTCGHLRLEWRRDGWVGELAGVGH